MNRNICIHHVASAVPLLILILQPYSTASLNFVPSTTDGRAEFFVNVELNQIQKAKEWIDQGGDVNVQSSNGRTALMRACQEQHTDMIQFLIASGADVNIQDSEGVTSIGLLSYQQDSMEILLRKQCIVTLRDIEEAYADGYDEKGDLLQDYFNDDERNTQAPHGARAAGTRLRVAALQMELNARKAEAKLTLPEQSVQKEDL